MAAFADARIDPAAKTDRVADGDEMGVVPDGYSVGKSLCRTATSEVYEAVRESDGTEVVLKVYLADQTRDLNARAVREFQLLRRLHFPGIPRALALDRTEARPLLVLERLPGLSLACILEEGPLELETWLSLASALAETLAQIHAARLLHKDLTPRNVLVDRQSGRAWIIDFGLAAELGSADRSSPRDSGALEGTLRYIAPEQSGRMNRGLDFRSDLYSLGATLYHALTGRPPFESTDALELIHSHIARLPTPPVELRPEIPAAISRLILKLLSKEPEARYQSARSLYADLSACRDQLGQNGRIEANLVLGGADAPDRPLFSRKLRGRERESNVLYDAYARAALGSTHALMIRGESGVGKSALIAELGPRLAQSGGYLAVGKFESDRDRPYVGWAAAVESLVQQLLLESDLRLERWRGELRAGLGNIASALIDLIADLQFIIGDVPPVPPLGPRETQARLSLALQRFVATCATREHPLVLFLDDLQWSDAGSRALLEDLLCAEQHSSLLLIGSYRASEVHASHPLAQLFARLADRHVELEFLSLEPPSPEAVLAMLAEALERTPDATRSLADLIQRKTGNSPLLVQQFIDHIHERALLRYQRGVGWVWHPDEIVAADIPDGAVALMIAKLEHLEPEPRAVLQFASCVGDEFDVELLSELGHRSREPLEEALYTLCAAGLIAPCPNGFRFVHDRIREAAQSLLSHTEISQLHWETGQLLLSRTPEAEQQARVFEIVEHLNRGLAHLPETQRLAVVELDLLAGKRALAAGAGATASTYLSVARDLFREEDWRERHALGFDLHLQSAESVFQNGDCEAALSLLDALDRQSLSVAESLQVAVKRIQLFALTRDPEDSVRYTLEVLRGMGVRWPLHPSRARVWLTVRVVRWMLRRRDPEQPFFPAEKVDLSWAGPLIILAAAGAVLVRLEMRLGALGSCLVIRRYMRWGYLLPGFTLAAYAVHSHLVLGKGAEAQRLGRTALQLSESIPDPIYGPRTQLLIHAALNPWLLPRRQALAPMDRIAQQAREIGDPEFAYYARFFQGVYLALAGDVVGAAEARLRELCSDVLRSGHRYPEPGRCHDAYRLLLASDVAHDELAQATLYASIPRDAEPYGCTVWMLVLCVHGRFELAFEQSEALGDQLFRIVPFAHVADHTFYLGLAAAALAGRASGRARLRYRRVLRQCSRRLRRWAREGPDFVHMLGLLDAESARLRGAVSLARGLYERAGQRARQQGFVHHAALAQERRARMLMAERREVEAGSSFKEAIKLYESWGAQPKAEALAGEYRSLTGKA